MTETEAGHLNQPNLIDECADSLSIETNSWPDWLWFSPEEQGDAYKKAVMSILAVLRKRGLVTAQCLEILERDSK